MNRFFIFLIPFCFDCAMSFFWLGVSHFLINIGGHQEQLGILTSIIYGVQIPFYIYLGQIISKIGKHRLLLIGLFFVVAFTIDLCFVKIIPIFFVVACFVTIGHAFFYPSFTSIISDYTSIEKAPGDSIWFNIGWCGGSCTASIISPIILHKFEHTSLGLKSLGLSCLIFGIFTFISILVNNFYLKRQEIHTYKKKEESEIVPHNEIYLNSSRIISLLGAIASSTFLFIFPKIFKDLGWETSKVVLLSGMIFNGVAVATVLCLFVKFWKSNMAVNVIGNLIMLIASLLCLYFRDYFILMCIFIFLVGAVGGIAGNALMFHTLCSPLEQRDRNLGIMSGIAAVASVVAGLLGYFGGLINKIYKVQWVININLYLLIIGCLLTFVVFYRYYKVINEKNSFRN